MFILFRRNDNLWLKKNGAYYRNSSGNGSFFTQDEDKARQFNRKGGKQCVALMNKPQGQYNYCFGSKWPGRELELYPIQYRFELVRFEVELTNMGPV